MGLAVIPTDWTSGYTEICVRWPNSPEWLAILRGQLTDPGYDYFWDTFTGNPDDAKPAIFPTFNQNLHLEVCMSFQTGMVMIWPLIDPPTGWLAYNGQMVQKSDYPALWTFLGDMFGENEFEFQVGPSPGRFPVQHDPDGTYAAVMGETGGAAEVTLDTSEMPNHNHTQDSHNHTQNSHNHTQDSHNHTQNAHSHTYNGNVYINQAAALFSTGAGGNNINAQTPPGTTATNIAAAATNQPTTAVNQAATATNQSAGGDGAHNNLPPFFVTNFIIKT